MMTVFARVCFIDKNGKSLFGSENSQGNKTPFDINDRIRNALTTFAQYFNRDGSERSAQATFADVAHLRIQFPKRDHPDFDITLQEAEARTDISIASLCNS